MYFLLGTKEPTQRPLCHYSDCSMSGHVSILCLTTLTGQACNESPYYRCVHWTMWLHASKHMEHNGRLLSHVEMSLWISLGTSSELQQQWWCREMCQWIIAISIPSWLFDEQHGYSHQGEVQSWVRIVQVNRHSGWWAREADCKTSWYHSEWEGTIITEERTNLIPQWVRRNCGIRAYKLHYLYMSELLFYIIQ